MGHKELLWAEIRTSFFRPLKSKHVISQHHHPLTRHFCAQSARSTNFGNPQELKKFLIRAFAVGKEKCCGVPYFPVVLGFAVSGCLGAGLLVVFADGESHGLPTISNSGGWF